MTEEEKINILNSTAILRKGIKTLEWSQGNEVYGCTDPIAANYCNTCTVDDGSCYYIASAKAEN